jgi:anti-sigma factor RsiW
MSECNNIKRRLADYSVGGLRRRARARVQAHLDTCVSCRAELSALERTAALVTRAGLEAAPDHWAQVRLRLPSARAGTPVRLRLVWSLAAATFTALIVVLGVFLRPSRTIVRPRAVPAVRADDEMRASLEGHLAASWSAPLGDEAALGLGMAAAEGEG